MDPYSDEWLRRWCGWHLYYDSSTGLFWWKKRAQGRKMNKPSGTRHADGYVSIRIDGKHYLAHRLAWFLYYGDWPEQQIDHINGIKDDNRIENLRDVDGATNTHNRPSGNIHKYWNRFRVQIQIRGKTYDKRFATLEEAKQQLEEWRKKI